MRQILILQTKTLEPLNDMVIAVEQGMPDVRVEVLDLTVERPDYARVVEQIFAADSVQVW